MKPVEPKRDDGVELETQLILRLPKEPAKSLREAIQAGANNLKDRLNIKLEQDLRYGEVRFDHWLMHAKVVDLPTVIESLKTIDNKSFYKTADICQMIQCKDEPDAPSADEESPNKAKKKDPNKVDKKFLWPHGVTPPCKNVRKRRFRKTLKKKYVEAPEIEKEVKRLLRVDNEAVNVRYDIINEDEDHNKGGGSNQHAGLESESGVKISTKHADKSKSKNTHDIETESMAQLPSTPRGVVAEHDIFGGEVSSSEDEEESPNVHDIEDISRLSADDSRLSDFSMPPNSNVDKMFTEFNKSMFSPKSRKADATQDQLAPEASSSMAAQDFYTQNRPGSFDDNDSNEPQMSRQQINSRIMEFQRVLDALKVQHSQKSQEIASIQNPTLRMRMQETVDNLMSMILDKEMEIQDLQNKLES
ncbi:unnamed protein product [Hermetia illucens]|uniref:TAFII55 protein conserved region domain-containing protein n=2 Tax=Hermetia illucens TaxID=343691 RepID=A0A7R8Z4W4_HERIL|nr:unnamed protein product [Hermetia illucens]